MNNQEQPTLSSHALTVLSELRNWTNGLPPNSVVVREDRNLNYGGSLFEMQPAQPGAMDVTVGLSASDDIDIFWGEGYRWEGWTATAREVLEVCEAIKEGDVVEEMWRLGRFVIERRCYIRLQGHRVGDGSYPVPAWIKKWARLSVRTYSPWVARSPVVSEFLEVTLEHLPTEAGGRTPPIFPREEGSSYRPHFRVGDAGEYLGVEFIDGPSPIPPGGSGTATVALVYEVDYSPLSIGAVFDVLEGDRLVATGTVVRRWSGVRG